MEIKKGQKATASPILTGLDDWIEGTIIDIEENPFKGLVIAIKDQVGRIFFGEEKYFKFSNKNNSEICMQ